MFVAITNTKGGVGKSTIASHMAVWLFDQGKSVALLDTDKQRSSSEWVAEAEPQITVRSSVSPDDIASEAVSLRESHEFVVADGPAGLAEESRTLLILADLALFPVLPSILDLRSVAQATSILKYAQTINDGRPEGRLVLNRIRKRDVISRELREAAPALGLDVLKSHVRDLQAFRDAAQQGTVVTRMKGKAKEAARDIEGLFKELFRSHLATRRRKRAANE